MLSQHVAESFEYRDAGCDLAPSCLDCPFERCVEDEPRTKQRLLKLRRKKVIVDLKAEGHGTQEIACVLGVSLRTVQRALRARKSKTLNKRET